MWFAPGKRVYVKSVSGVRIPLSPLDCQIVTTTKVKLNYTSTG